MKRIKDINAFAPIVQSTQSKVSVDSVLNIKGFDLERTLEMDPEFLDTDAEHEHDESVGSISIKVDGDAHMMLLNDFISDILKNKGTDVYRMKGVLAIAGSTHTKVRVPGEELRGAKRRAGNALISFVIQLR